MQFFLLKAVPHYKTVRWTDCVLDLFYLKVDTIKNAGGGGKPFIINNLYIIRCPLILIAKL